MMWPWEVEKSKILFRVFLSSGKKWIGRKDCQLSLEELCDVRFSTPRGVCIEMATIGN